MMIVFMSNHLGMLRGKTPSQVGHKVIRVVVVKFIITLLHIFHRMYKWKNLENRSIFGKVVYKSWKVTFLAHPLCYVLTSKTLLWHCTPEVPTICL